MGFGALPSIVFVVLVALAGGGWVAWRATQAVARERACRVAAERAVAERDREVAAAVEASNDGLWERDYAEPRTRVSARFETLLGFPPGRFAEQDIAPEDLVHAGDVPRLKEAFRAHAKLFQPFVVELRMRHASGRYVWVRVRGHSERDHAGRVTKLLGSVTDITELREALERFRDLTQMTSDWYWEQDAQFRFTRFERGESHSLFITDGLIGKTRWELPLDIDPERMAAHRRLLEAHQAFQRLEYRIRNDLGEWLWVSVNGKPVFDESGRFFGYRGTATDITEHKRLEEELTAHRDNLTQLVESQTADLIRAKEVAEHASQAKSEFLANMSHELRTPMHAILAFARLGQGKTASAPPEKLKEYFDRIVTSGERLLDLMDALLDLSKLEAGKAPPKSARVDLMELAGDVACDLDALAGARNQGIDFAPTACDTWVSCDALRLSQVIRNLLSNALKFSPPGCRVTIEFAPAELAAGRRAEDQGTVAALRMTIVDPGIGIPDDELEAVFDKFVQSSKTNDGSGGTGLGLAICREIVQAHRGTIAARNRPEGGAAFDVVLPR